MFDDRTPEAIRGEILENMGDTVQTREGSFASELAGPVAVELYMAYQAIAAMLPTFYVDEGSGGFIDIAAARYGIYRKEGTKARADILFSGRAGVLIPSGTTFLTEAGLEFRLDEDVTLSTDGAGVGKLTAAGPGDAYNVPAQAVSEMAVTLTGVESWTAGEAQGGADEESDTDLVGRLYDHWRKPATSGNVYDYERWALEVPGVGAAKVLPTWAGAGTVKVLLCSPERRGVDETVVATTKDHIETNRPIGATVTVVSAGESVIDVSATLTLDGSVSLAEVKERLVSKLDTYLRSLAFEEYTVLYNRIAFLVLDVDGVTDYTALTVNGGAENVAIPADQIPVAGVVTLK